MCTCTALYQVQLISAKINLKVLASEAVGASMKMVMMMKKEVKFSSCDNVIHQVSHKITKVCPC